jgi:AmmeMemoRadiSam system protein B
VLDATMIRKAAVAGSWYPGSAHALAAAVDRHLASATRDVDGDLVALIAPHAGLIYSGPVACPRVPASFAAGHSTSWSSSARRISSGFEGVSVYRTGGYATPLGVADIDTATADALVNATPVVRDYPAAHGREHSLEMQLPFLQHLAPGVPIVPLLMGHQTAATAHALGGALASTLSGRRALIVASTDLSHYYDAATAQTLDRVVIDCVRRFDADALQAALDVRPDHACGGGPAVAVMRAAHALGATESVVLQYADSGDVSGDKTSVVGYLAAAFGRFSRAAS